MHMGDEMCSDGFHTSQAGNIGGVAVSLCKVSLCASTLQTISHLHKNLKRSMLSKLVCAAPICVQHLLSSGSDVLSAKQLMHSRACGVHGIQDDEVASTIAAAFETNDGDRMTGLLQINRRQKGLVDVGAIVNGSLSKVTLDGIEE